MRQRGMTLLEVMLVIAIATSLVLLGVQTYQQFSLQNEKTKIAFNINVLFQAMRNYYYANCIANRNPATDNRIDATVGLMDPTITTPSGTNLVLDITTNLITRGYLTNWKPALSPMATNYVVQFNLYNDASVYTGNVRSVQFCFSSTSDTSGTCKAQPTLADNNIYLWTIQVAIKFASAAKASQYKNLLGADCVSSLVNGAVTPCSQSPTAVDYVVFERLPSFAAPTANSPLWLSDPMLKLFKRQYTNDDDYAVTKQDDASYLNKGYQNYLCGG
jgi:prepilin-type N-terminal cleavage/methylation domain-containing protein